MSVQAKDFKVELLKGEEPKKHSGKDEYTTINVKYGGGKFKILTAYPGVYCNPLGESPKNNHKITQGFSLETPEMVKMHEEASKALLQMVVDRRDHPNMPKFCKNFKTVADILQAKKFGTTVKTMIHHPEKRDDDGKGTGEHDPDATPKCYVSLIRSGPNSEKNSSKIWTRFYSGQILNPKIDALIKSGAAKEEDYMFDPLDLLRRKVAMKAMPCYEVTDIYLADGNVVVRMALSELYIIKFETKESQARKELRGQLALAGIEIEGPSSLPDGEPEPSKAEDMAIDPPQNSGEKEFTVTVTE